MSIFDLFSKRQSDAAKAGTTDVYQYDQIPDPLRVQVHQIAIDAIGRVGMPGDRIITPSESNDWWDELERLFLRERGLDTIGSGEFAGKRILIHMRSCPVTDWLDLLELIGIAILAIGQEKNSYFRQKWQVATDSEKAIDEINYRMRQAAVGYQLEAGQLIRVDSQVLHAEVVKPALHLLDEKRFGAANQEFRKAHQEFRAGSFADTIADCGKALESVLKVIAKERGWPGISENSALSKLIEAAIRNQFFPSYLEEQLTGLRQMLQGTGTVRNKDGAHGKGDAKSNADRNLAAYQLHQTAAAIVFIADTAR